MSSQSVILKDGILHVLEPTILVPAKEIPRYYSGPKLRLAEVYKALREGRVPGIKHGWNWFVDERDLPAVWPTESVEAQRERQAA